ncbi:MAG: cyclic nucleotide-binding domain-containing protein [Verrucomicrobia bacterium]|nr:cyclic nucleotide-binding domain-containing protein [Verrucomicrobiota bacterium]
MNPETLQQVRATPLFAGLDDAQIGCIEPGEVIDVPVGTVLVTEGEHSAFFFLVLAGEIRLTRTYDKQSILMGAIKPGNYTGETTLLLDIPWLATARVSKPARLFRLGEDDFWHMLSTCRSVAREIFRSAANKVRNMEGYSQQREKLASLGTMAAGLAHELNNPAAAARRAAAHLQETTDKVQQLLCSLTKTLGHDHWQHLLPASQDALERLTHAPVLDHLERSDRAEAIAAWLETHGMASAYELAPTFVSAGLDSVWLEELTSKLPAASRADALGWLGARINLKSLLGQVEQSTGRIAELVKAVKSYSYMDQSPMQEVDIHEGLDSTLTMLGHKLKNVTLMRAFDRSLPRIPAYGSELNQVWTNLIDNAIHAVNGTGRICVGTCLADNQLLVEIVDNGAGIPPEVQAHMFEPFFTTKPVGSGTGLGLIISNRIVADRHGGEIEFESKPGETRFKVRLPLHRSEPSILQPNGSSTNQLNDTTPITQSLELRAKPLGFPEK